MDAVAEAIRTLRVRGAPLIGIAAAMGVTLALRAGSGTLEAVVRRRGAARRDPADRREPALGPRPDGAARGGRGAAPARIWPTALRAEANAIWDEDRAMCARIGVAGAQLIGGDARVLRTATRARSRPAASARRSRRCTRCTRPGGSVVGDRRRDPAAAAGQPAHRLGADPRRACRCTVIADSMAASRLRRGDVTCVIVGADRIAANGDVANKIGTYGVALAARAHGVPFYVAAPSSTVDPATPDGARIPIEERAADEVRGWRGRAAAPGGRASLESRVRRHARRAGRRRSSPIGACSTAGDIGAGGVTALESR